MSPRKLTGKLSGKVAIVSGSGRGIGRALAQRLAEDGAHVVVNDVDEEPAQEAVAEITDRGGSAIICVGDVAAPNFGDVFVASAIERFGGLDIIVNNAGFSWNSPLWKMTDEQFQTMIDVHLFGPFRILRAAARPIREFAKAEAAAGREVFRKVVNVSSLAGTSGNPGQLNYASAKAGVLGMTKTLAREWGRYKVNVNCVAFGHIATRLTQAVESERVAIKVGDTEFRTGYREDRLQALAHAIPIGRAGTPAEAAQAVAFFCGPDSDYVSGQTLICGGGLNSLELQFRD